MDDATHKDLAAASRKISDAMTDVENVQGSTIAHQLYPTVKDLADEAHHVLQLLYDELERLLGDA